MFQGILGKVFVGIPKENFLGRYCISWGIDRATLRIISEGISGGISKGVFERLV